MRGAGRQALAGFGAALLLAWPALAQAPPPAREAPPARIGPVWDGREHQPNPAEIEARSRARGLPEARETRDARDVDKLYRDLTGSDPQAQPRTSPRDADRR
ncbi:hypothetical protein [Paracraurococcus ruber]|uniref:DUF4148 domain-containing protein n=1 Tax=Paracraurococcus ruber TaxID=77675 RepID=A0ABS1CXL2_9PROT|nr:hypothetical protein [Paracraurococcus ruber]MBK1658459.1 hypothetical protein [Paracraurococcus ruber]TDG16334.1 hypothetical protein E2C05_29415 [Paracraurococcus ruber]